MMQYKLTQLNSDLINEFEHRLVVFTRLTSTGNGKDIPYARALQIWDAKTDKLILTLEFDPREEHK